MSKQVDMIFWLRIRLLLGFFCLINSELRDDIQKDLDGQTKNKFVPQLNPDMYSIDFVEVLGHDDVQIIKVNVEKSDSPLPFAIKNYRHNKRVSTIVLRES